MVDSAFAYFINLLLVLLKIKDHKLKRKRFLLLRNSCKQTQQT